ncbi:MAG: ABC transporter ATP-binding protein [Desulfurococcales archaeon]|nr:ABC transporter ATP-binding protein [Desulfurococcales archaeon]
MDNTILEVVELKKYFPITSGILNRVIGYVRAVDGVSLRVYRGSTHAIVGETGCGKSTLARVIAGIYEPTGGRIIFDGIDLSNASVREKREARKSISMVFQDPTSSLNPRHRVLDIVTAPLRVNRIGSKPERLKRAREMIRMVELGDDVLHKYPHELSGGQRQRVAIARALITEPKLVILDEPTSSLDVSVQAKIVDLLLDLKKKLGLTYMLITHNLGLARNMATHVSVMYAGKIVETSPAEDLFANPSHPYTRALIAAIPPVDPAEEAIIRKHGLPARGGEPPSLTNPPRGCRFHPRCPLALQKCKEKEPPRVEISQEHYSWCWLD